MNLEVQTCIISLWAGGQSVHKTASILFVVHDARDGSAQNRNYYGWAPYEHYEDRENWIQREE